MLTVKVWASTPNVVKTLHNARNDGRLTEALIKENTQLLSDDCGMEDYGWVRLGTAEISYDISVGAAVMQAAVGAFDLAEARLREEFNQKFAELMQAKQEFLALPAAVKGDDDETYA